MTKKAFNLAMGITGGASTIAAAIVAYVNPVHSVAIVAAVGIAATAVNEILSLFVKDE